MLILQQWISAPPAAPSAVDIGTTSCTISTHTNFKQSTAQ
jgi:hypothetical protein